MDVDLMAVALRMLGSKGALDVWDGLTLDAMHQLRHASAGARDAARRTLADVLRAADQDAEGREERRVC